MVIDAFRNLRVLGVGRIACLVLPLAASLVGCSGRTAAPWSGPELTRPRTHLTVEQMQSARLMAPVDLSFMSRPAWAEPALNAIEGTLTFTVAQLQFPLEREPYLNETRFPAFSIDVMSRGGELIPAQTRLIFGQRDPVPEGAIDGGWEVFIGVGRVWHEPDDGPWSRASLPINLTNQYMGAVRNCVGSFLFDDARVSPLHVQCSQETADILDKQLTNSWGRVALAYAASPLTNAQQILIDHQQRQARRLPVKPLSALGNHTALSQLLDRTGKTSAPTSQAAVYFDGTLYTHPASTRHGPYPYPADMRHGVYSVSKSLAGALAMFYLAQRYGDELFDTPVQPYVPAFAGLAEWQDVTFGHLLNMATGTRGGEAANLLLEPLILASDAASAIAAIARLGDAPGAPGTAFHYATTHTFVLSYALQRYVAQREGDDVAYWDLVTEGVLEPIGAHEFNVLFTRDPDPTTRIPILGYGARPTLDTAARIAALMAREGRHNGRQLLSRQRVREALGRTPWRGYPAGQGRHYRHSFWAQSVRTDRGETEITYMQGHGDNHVVLMANGAIVLRFMDEFEGDLPALVRAADRLEFPTRR